METKAKTIKGLFQSYIQQAKKIGNIDIQLILEEMLVEVQRIQKESVAVVTLNSWKGKDRIQYIEKVDSFDIITHQKADQDSEPKKSITNITKEEINRVIDAINFCPYRQDEDGNKFKHSVDIAEKFALLSGIDTNHKGHYLFNDLVFDYERFFGDRKLHKNLNLSLRLLDFYEVIKYRGKRSIILNNNFKFQLKLEQ